MKTAVFTIISNNYSAQARTLLQSLRLHEPSWDRHVLVVDKPWKEKLIEPAEGLVRHVGSLSLPVPHWFFFQYDIIEANTAVKPWMFTQLFDEGYEAVVYLDPDIKLYSPLPELKERLVSETILLTPHITKPYGDESYPKEGNIRQAGIHNLGFAAMRNSPVVREALTWWQGKLTHDCRSAVHEGIFVDQSWMDFAPCFFQAKLLNDPGYNIAYWNLHERPLQTADFPASPPRCEGTPVGFFHFSAFDYRNPLALSRHQNRYNAVNLPEGVSVLLHDYARSLVENGIESHEKIPYALNRLDGLLIPDYLRLFLISHPPVQAMILNNTPASGLAQQLIDYLCMPDPQFPSLPLFMARLYAIRQDLIKYFKNPVPQLSDPSFVDWFNGTGRHESGLDPAFPVKGWWDRETTPQKLLRLIRKRAPHRIWGKRSLAKRYLRFLNELYQSLHYQSPRPAPWRQLDGKKPRINLFGYFLAPSGMGEVARSTSRALTRLGFEHRIINLDHLGKKRTCELPFSLPDPRADIDIAAVNADAYPTFTQQFLQEPGYRRYRVGYWLWEMETPPQGFSEAEALVNEIWAASKTNALTFQGRSSCPVRVAGLNLSEDWTTSQPFPFPEIDYSGRCVFLTMCDCLSYPERKNPIGALQAYLEAFPRERPDSLLLVKIQNGSHRPETSLQLKQLAAQRRDIVIRDVVLSSEEVMGLMQHSDVLISLHRQEGFGLPIAEALSLGKKVVVTGYGGNMDFCHSENAHLVPFQLSPLEKDIGPYLKGNSWATPDIPAAAIFLRNIQSDWSKGLLKSDPSDAINEKCYRQIENNIESIIEFLSKKH